MNASPSPACARRTRAMSTPCAGFDSLSFKTHPFNDGLISFVTEKPHLIRKLVSVILTYPMIDKVPSRCLEIACAAHLFPAVKTHTRVRIAGNPRFPAVKYSMPHSQVALHANERDPTINMGGFILSSRAGCLRRVKPEIRRVKLIPIKKVHRVTP